MNLLIKIKNFILSRPLLKNAAIMMCFTLGFFLIDWLTKEFIFDSTRQYNFATHDNVYSDWKVVAWTSLEHPNTTFLSFLNIKMPDWTYDFINMTLVAIFVISVMLCSKTLSAIGMSITLGGILGNGLDMVAFNYVRDVMFIPWIDHGNAGVFNFADVFIIVGAIVSFVSLIEQLVEDFKKDKATKNAIQTSQENNNITK